MSNESKKIGSSWTIEYTTSDEDLIADAGHRPCVVVDVSDRTIYTRILAQGEGYRRDAPVACEALNGALDVATAAGLLDNIAEKLGAEDNVSTESAEAAIYDAICAIRPDQYLDVWTASEWLVSADNVGLAADTTDAELAAMADDLTDEADTDRHVTINPHTPSIEDVLNEWLDELRSDLAD